MFIYLKVILNLFIKKKMGVINSNKICSQPIETPANIRILFKTNEKYRN